jgi:predicted phosphodiesterase
MEIIILHISDIHLKISENPILDKIGDLNRVLRSMMKEYDACFVVISGDLAYSGKKEEYEKAFDLIASIDESIRKVSTIATHEFLLIPGNHDCDLSKDDKTRKSVTKSILSNQNDYDTEMLHQFLKVQDDFEIFKNAVFDSDSTDLDRRFYTTQAFNVSGRQVVFDLVNTSWLSKIPEELGHLLGPPENIFKNRQEFDDYSLRIAVLHHPLHWLVPDASRTLRETLESQVDIILTGHEHIQSQYSRSEHGSTGADYIEGGVLQDSKNPDLSSFNIIEASLINRIYKVSEWIWDKKTYILKKESSPQPFKRSQNGSRKSFALTDSFYYNYLKNPGAQYSHPRKDNILFDDLYTAPDFRKFNNRMSLNSSSSRPISGTRAFAEIETDNLVVISGNEKVGKTSAIKHLYWKGYSAGIIPILLNGDAIDKSHVDSIQSVLKKAFADQYDSGKTFEDFKSLGREKRILFIDDFHQSALSVEGRSKVLRYLEVFFERVVVIGDDGLRIEQLSGDKRNRELFKGYSHFQIMEFGYLLREKLISRWILLGGEDALEDSDYNSELKQRTTVVSSILGKNVVPAYPLFILVILQQMEAGTATRTATGSYGYFYESLITDSLAAVLNQKEVDTYYNLIAELAYRLYNDSTRNISRDQFKDFVSYYNKEYQLSLNAKVVEQKLVESRILFHRGKESLRFQYKYVYYYFIARHAAHNLSELDRATLVNQCVKFIHTERSANIVIFLSYLSRDPSIIEALISGARANYLSTAPCDFDEHVKRIAKLQSSVPQFILPDGDPEVRRLAALEARDASSPRTKETGELAHDEDDVVDFDEKMDEILALNRAFKSMQVLGQVVRNFAGSLKANSKNSLADECVSLGLRSINYMFGLLQENIDDVVEYVKSRLREKNENIADIEIEERAKLLIFFLCEASASGVTRRIATDIGSPDLTITYEELLKQNPTAAYAMVDLAIKMDHRADFPADEVIALGERLSTNVFAKAVLCELVVGHFYLFRVPEPIKQRVCEKLGIGIKQAKLQNPAHKRLGRFDS